MFFVILFVVLTTVMVLTGVIANRAFRKRDVDQMKNIVTGRAQVEQGAETTPLMKKQRPNPKCARGH